MDTIEQHLDPAALARLVDERPAPVETAHLAACQRCRDELAALSTDRDALAALETLSAPLDGWRRIEAALGRPENAPAARPPWSMRAPIRMAAAIALFLAGLGSGALVTGGAGAGDGVATATPATDPVVALAEAELAYLEALARFGDLTDDPLDGDPMARLVALESIVQATGVALQHAPADPVINGYHLSARGQRDETLRHVARLASAEWYR